MPKRPTPIPKAIALIGKPQDRHWTLFYTRGISYERSKRWADAERDLKFALKLKPEQPLVMNYLAYTWVEQSVNMAEALADAEERGRTAAGGRLHHRQPGLGALPHGRLSNRDRHISNRRSCSSPARRRSTTIWAMPIGASAARLEAKYQWQHALTLKPEKADEPKIRRKIEAGLTDLPPVPAQAGTPQSGQ